MRTSKRYIPLRGLVILAALLLVCTPIARRAWADANTGNINVQKLLDEARIQSHRLDMDADSMTGMIHSNLSWQIHADELVRIKSHVNELGRLITELQSSRTDASPWQREAIDRVVPLLREVAADTSDEINWLNRNQDRPTTPKYDQWVKQNGKTAHELAGLISDTVQYGQDRGKLADLSDSLGLKARASR